MAQIDGIKYWLSKQKFAQLYTTEAQVLKLIKSYPYPLDLSEVDMKANSVEEALRKKQLAARHKKKQYWEFRKFATYMINKHANDKVENELCF